MRIIVDVASRGEGITSTFASMVLLIAGACVRFRHLQRSKLTDLRDKAAIFYCLKGKRRQQGTRPGFGWASPRCWAPGQDALARPLRLVTDVS